jgi:hypothetical protein
VSKMRLLLANRGRDIDLTSVEAARRALLDSLEEVRAQERRIQEALDALGNGSPSGNAKPGRRRPVASSSGRAPRGQRKAQFLREVQSNPGLPVAKIAAKLEMAPSQAYTLARRLTKSGEIKKRGKGYAIRS